MLSPPPISAMPSPDLGLALGLLFTLVGLVLLLAGRLVDRAVLALGGASLGAALAGPLAQAWGVNWMVLSIPAAVILAVVFVLSGRVLWALLGAAMLAGLGSLVVAAVYWPALSPQLEQHAEVQQPAATAPAGSQPATAASQPSGRPWAAQAIGLGQYTMAVLWKQQPAVMVWTFCLAGGLPLAAAVLLPRLARIVMTSIIGSLCCTGGLVLLLSAVRSQAWPTRWVLVAIWAMLAAVLMVAGVIHQYYRALSAPAARPPAAPPKPPAKPGK